MSSLIEQPCRYCAYRGYSKCDFGMMCDHASSRLPSAPVESAKRFTPPRYDETYFEAMDTLDKISSGEIDDGLSAPVEAPATEYHVDGASAESCDNFLDPELCGYCNRCGWRMDRHAPAPPVEVVEPAHVYEFLQKIDTYLHDLMEIPDQQERATSLHIEAHDAAHAFVNPTSRRTAQDGGTVVRLCNDHGEENCQRCNCERCPFESRNCPECPYAKVPVEVVAEALEVELPDPDIEDGDFDRGIASYDRWDIGYSMLIGCRERQLKAALLKINALERELAQRGEK